MAANKQASADADLPPAVTWEFKDDTNEKNWTKDRVAYTERVQTRGRLTDSWQSMYQAGKHGWARPVAHPALVQLITAAKDAASAGGSIGKGTTAAASGSPPPLPTGGSVLVPGCGFGPASLAFAEAGAWPSVLGADIAEEALVSARRDAEQAIAKKSLAKNIALSYEVLDFFDTKMALPNQPFQVIYDYTFFCAIDPAMRADWARRMAQLLVPRTGQLVTLVFPIASWDRSIGPPFIATPDDYAAVLHPLGFRCIEMRRLSDDQCHVGRQGMEWIARWILVA